MAKNADLYGVFDEVTGALTHIKQGGQAADLDLATLAGTVVDADAATKGKVQLAGALGGTAAAPTALGHANAASLTAAIDAAAAAAAAAVVAAAPGTLNTLDELAAALGDDANFASTVTTLIGTKLNSSAVSAYGLTLVDDVDAAAARATLGFGSTDAGIVAIYKPTATPTIAISQSLASAARIAVPAGAFGKNSLGILIFNHQKVTAGAADQPSANVYAVPVGGGFDAAKKLGGGWTTPASANGLAQAMMFVFGNGADTTTVHCTQQTNIQTPTSAAIAAAGLMTSAQDTSAAWDLLITLSTGANDTAKVNDAVFIIINPELAGTAVAYAPLPVGASRALAPTDNGKTLVCAAGVTLTVDTGLQSNFSCMAYATTGQVTFAAGTGTILNGDGHLKSEKANVMVSLVATTTAGQLMLGGRTGV